jgi:hypothetical protein
MFYKIECYIEAENIEQAEAAATDVAFELGGSPRVIDHVIKSGRCTAVEARNAGLLRITAKASALRKR